MRLPSIALAIAINRAVRERDEWFDEPDDLDRVERAIATVEAIDEPVEAAAILACRVARAQGFTEGHKRTALLLARWVLDRNGVDGAVLLPPDDRQFGDLLVKAAAGSDVEDEAVALLIDAAQATRDHSCSGWHRRVSRSAQTTSTSRPSTST